MKIGIYSGINVGSVKDSTIEYIGVDQGVYHYTSRELHL